MRDMSLLWGQDSILQVDGEVVEEDEAKYSFLSMFAEEDILYTINEIF